MKEQKAITALEKQAQERAEEAQKRFNKEAAELAKRADSPRPVQIGEADAPIVEAMNVGGATLTDRFNADLYGIG